jgi:hypothetical protein
MISDEMKTAYNTKILDLARYNGRVNLVSQPDHAIQFQMAEKVAVKNKAIEYRGALTGEWEDNVLAQVFFSAENMQIIQNGIRAGVYQRSKGKYVIGEQDCDTLRIIMRTIFLQNATNAPTEIRAQIIELNELVFEYCVPRVHGEAEGYIQQLENAILEGEFLEKVYRFDPTLKDENPFFTPEEESFARSGQFIEV